MIPGEEPAKEAMKKTFTTFLQKQKDELHAKKYSLIDSIVANMSPDKRPSRFTEGTPLGISHPLESHFTPVRDYWRECKDNPAFTEIEIQKRNQTIADMLNTDANSLNIDELNTRFGLLDEIDDILRREPQDESDWGEVQPHVEALFKKIDHVLTEANVDFK
ncbi:hypothetical protein ACFLQ2_02910 [archaeon]